MNMNGRSAFSLVELVVVAAITAIIAAIAVPTFASAAQESRVDLAARRVAADLRLAQRLARLTSSSRAVDFSVAEDSYELVGVAHPDRPASAYVVSLSSEPYRVDLVYADAGGKPQIEFDGFGRPSSGGVIRVRVGTHERLIVVDADSGQATVQ